MTITTLEVEEAEIIPGKHSDTRIKPLPLTNGHGRYITVTSERTLLSFVHWEISVEYIAVKFLAVSPPKPPCNGRFASATAIWIQKLFLILKPVRTSRKL